MPAWKGSTSPALARSKLGPILEKPTATIDDALGGTPTNVFLGQIGNTDVAIHVFKEGPHAGQIGTALVPGPGQRAMWGLGP